ncbi:TPA: hypothetical protein DIV48_01875 [Candidatus Kaiserbacteria bacterium]|nr:MAG: hypothetical protein UY93_C0002G0125 [Parcubacteria group bacterium GW2011_GWA1_56_13]KKW45426.1 MAG: hypothetical protein UY97_C0022G0003 [Parcubacteria group bacterium GW2011_GWB1_57_6]HCR52380.1 hypothetical protein [Candidatus Kaiserbacteria bacterium]
METNMKLAGSTELSQAHLPNLWADALRIFFEAMVSGQEDYVRSPWTVRIKTLVNPSGNGFSRAVAILYNGEPIWDMYTKGQYDERAMPCLEAALRGAYQQRHWLGGRGQQTFALVNVTYRNSAKGAFNKPFRGHELIRFNGSLLGEADTMGGPLIPTW